MRLRDFRRTKGSPIGLTTPVLVSQASALSVCEKGGSIPIVLYSRQRQSWVAGRGIGLMRRTRLVGLLSAAFVAGSISVAAAQSALEPQRTPGGVTWVSGGIGFDESLALRKMEGDYNLRLLFAVQGTGEYLADIVVIIQNQQGQAVLEATSQGPRLLAQVPPGGYTITATSGGSTVTRRLTVPRDRTVENSFYFPAQ
jgi:hypothetical protein